jgi:hypothetical protein
MRTFATIVNPRGNDGLQLAERGRLAGGRRRARVRELKPPIFLWEPNDLLVFDSAQVAEQFVEGNIEGDIFDSEGRRLRFDVVGEDWRHPYVVLVLRQVEEEPTHQAALTEVLRQALKGSDPQELNGLSLDELVGKAVARFGFIR